MEASWLTLAGNILSVALLLAVLYVVGGMADNIKQIRRILEEQTDRAS